MTQREGDSRPEDLAVFVTPEQDPLRRAERAQNALVKLRALRKDLHALGAFEGHGEPAPDSPRYADTLADVAAGQAGMLADQMVERLTVVAALYRASLD